MSISCFKNCYSFLSSCFGAESTNEENTPLITAEKPEVAVVSTQPIASLSPLNPINLDQPSVVQLEILEGSPGSFYIGSKTPQIVVNQGLNILSTIVDPENIRKVHHPHITFIPAQKSENITPTTTLGSDSELRGKSVTLSFTELTISNRGNVCLLNPHKTDKQQDFLNTLEEKLKVQGNSREPHSVIACLDQQTTKDLFANPELYGFKYDENRNDENRRILIKKIEEPINFQVEISENRSPSQKLIAKAYGEGLQPPLPRDLEAEKQFIARQQEIRKSQDVFLTTFSKGSTPTCPAYNDPVRFNEEQLRLAVQGDAKGLRIPLTFTASSCITDTEEGQELWNTFKAEVSDVFCEHGYKDASISVVGSAGSGFSGNPIKPLKVWTPNSDVDCAIFSETLAKECLDIDCAVNSKIQMSGKYSVFKNSGHNDVKGFHDFEIGPDIIRLQQKWSVKLYGDVGTEKPHLPGRPIERIGDDEVDFKVNILTNPFFSAISFDVKSQYTL